MAEEKIELTPFELEEIKDDIKYKVKTTETLKHLIVKVDKINGLPKRVSSLETHRAIHWVIIILIFGGIITLAFKVLAKGLGGG